jgi:hypothetical protein
MLTALPAARYCCSEALVAYNNSNVHMNLQDTKGPDSMAGACPADEMDSKVYQSIQGTLALLKIPGMLNLSGVPQRPGNLLVPSNQFKWHC